MPMIQLAPNEMDALRPWFQPEAPGPPTGGPHVLNTSYGEIWVDHWPEPRAVLVDVARNYFLCGDPDALSPDMLRPHIAGFVAASPQFAPLLQATFAQLIVWDRVIYTLRDKPQWQIPTGFHTRRLGWEDAAHLEALSPDSRWVYKTWMTAANLAASGFAWGAFAADRLVSVACTWYLGDRYEEIGVVTEPEFRGLGLNAACTGALCEEIRLRSHIPSWTTSHDNRASQRVAEKVGFTFEQNDVLYVINATPPPPPRAASDVVV